MFIGGFQHIQSSVCVWIMMPPLCHQIITALEEDSTAQKMQLGYRLQQIAAAVENKVTDLWPNEQDCWERPASPELNSCSWTTGTELMDRAETAGQASTKQMFGGRGGERLCLFVSPLLQRFTHVRFMLTSEAWGPKPFTTIYQLCSSSHLENLSSLFPKWN